MQVFSICFKALRRNCSTNHLGVRLKLPRRNTSFWFGQMDRGISDHQKFIEVFPITKSGLKYFH